MRDFDTLVYDAYILYVLEVLVSFLFVTVVYLYQGYGAVAISLCASHIFVNTKYNIPLLPIESRFNWI